MATAIVMHVLDASTRLSARFSEANAHPRNACAKQQHSMAITRDGDMLLAWQ
jgi:hypothetical protein